MKSLLTILFLTASVLLHAQNSNFLDYPIENIAATNVFSANTTLNKLFAPDNLINTTDEKGQKIVCHEDKRTKNRNIVTFIFTTLYNNKPVLRTIVKFKIKDDENSVEVVYAKLTNLISGQFSLAEYDGTQYSQGQVVGLFFSAAPEMIVDVKKVNQ